MKVKFEAKLCVNDTKRDELPIRSSMKVGKYGNIIIRYLTVCNSLIFKKNNLVVFF